jgi:hypothetical protein
MFYRRGSLRRFVFLKLFLSHNPDFELHCSCIYFHISWVQKYASNTCRYRYCYPAKEINQKGQRIENRMNQNLSVVIAHKLTTCQIAGLLNNISRHIYHMIHCFCHSAVAVSSLPVCCRSSLLTEEGEGVGAEPYHTTARKPGPL